MITGFLIKHPDAVAEYEFDFLNDIPENDSLIDYTLTVMNSAGDDVLATDEVAASAFINTSDITVEFSGGIEGENYFITVLGVLGTSTTNPVKLVEMRVRAKDV